MTLSRGFSVLAVDFGNVHTRAVLIDVVDGTYKPVAYAEVKTTGSFPHGDVNVGLNRAIRQITRATGRTLLNGNNQLIQPEADDRNGVDTFLITTSIGRPLRALLIGLTADLSIASAQRAVAGTYVQIVETLTLDDPRSENEQLNAIASSRPDLLFIVGGVEGGASDNLLMLARRAALALRLIRDGKNRLVLYAGDSGAAPQIEQMFEQVAQVLFAENVRPTIDHENPLPASAQLATAYDRIAAERGAGFELAAAHSALGVMATAQSYGLITRYLGKVNGSALAIDVGSGVSTLAAAIEDRSTTTIRSDLGLGHSAYTLIQSAGAEAVRRWLPFVATDEEIIAYALNKTLRPGTIPETLKELYIEHALLRTAVRSLLQTAHPLWSEKTRSDPDAPLPAFHTIIGAGAAFAKTGRPEMASLLLLDTLQPTGVTSLLLDNNALIPALGALARINQEAFVQLLAEGGIIPLGTCICLEGSPRPNAASLRVRITLPNGEFVKHEVLGGTLWIYPLPLGVRAMIDVRVQGNGLSIGGKHKLRMEVTGGTAGIIFDARGRPLPLGISPAERAVQVPAWYSQATGDAVRPIPEEWLTPPVREEQPELREVLASRASKENRPRSRSAEAIEADKQRSAKKLREQFKKTDTPDKPAPKTKKEDIDELRNLFP